MARAGWLSDLMEGQSALREWVQEKEAAAWFAAQSMNRLATAKNPDRRLTARPR